MPVEANKMIAMKRNFIPAFAVITLTLVGSSCKKYASGPPVFPTNDRKIRFELYTNQDFSGNTSIINFSIFIRTQNQTLLDSALASMEIKDIPDAAHKLAFEKTVSGYNNADLAAGFDYTIQNVGSSWYTDTSKAGTALKVIDYDFH